MLAYIYLLAAASLWSLLGIFTRYALEDGLSSFEIAFWRSCIGGFCFVVHALCTKKIDFSLPQSLYFALFGSIGIASLFTVYPLAIEAGGAALSVILLYTAPVWVAIFSRILFNEHFSSLKICAIILGIFGVFLVSLSTMGVIGESGFTISPKALIFGLLSGFLYASYYPFLTYFKNVDPITIYAIALPMAALVLYNFVDFRPKTSSTWIIIMAIGLLSTYLGFLTYGKGLKILGPVPAVMICNFEPIVGTFLAWLLWHESFTYLGFLGAFLVIFAVFVLAYASRPPKLKDMFNYKNTKQQS